MIHLRPNFGRTLNPGGGRLGDYFFREFEPGMYRINDSQDDVRIKRASPSDFWRLNSDTPGNGGLIRLGGFFRIFAP